MNVLVAGFTGDDTSRAVFLVCLRAHDARHHGRYGPQGFLRAFLPRRSHARCVQRQVPLVLETVQAQFSDKVARARVVLRHVPMVPETVQAQFLDKVVGWPVLCNDTCPWCSRQSTVVDVAASCAVLAPRTAGTHSANCALSWRSHRCSFWTRLSCPLCATTMPWSRCA